MQHHNFSIGQELIFRSVSCSVVRILDDRRIQLERLSGEISTHSEADLLRAFSKKELFFINKEGQPRKVHQPDQPDSNLLAFPVAQQNEIIRRAQYAMRIDQLKKTHGIIAATKIAIKELQKPDQKTPSIKTVYSWHKKWHHSGRDACALANKQRGPRKNSSWFTGETQARIYQFIAENYLTEDRRTMTHVHDLFKETLKKESKESGKKIKIPSLGTFYRHLAHFEAYDIECYRNGRAAAERKFRYIGAGILSTRALERAEIDHTPLDVILTDKIKGKTLGRAWLTMILDHYTKVPLGFYVSHSSPAQIAVLQAMRCAILPKMDIDKRYPQIAGKWLCYGIPSVLVFDNALEFHAHNIRRACAGLGITMMYCPPRHPHYKGSIERFLGTMNRSVCHILPGTTKSSPEERGDYDSEGRAIISLEDLTELIHMWIIDVYMNTKHRIINDTPRNAWDKSVADFPPVLPANCEELQLLLSHQGEKTLTNQGIVHNHLWYNCDELHALFRRFGGKTQVKYHFDIHDMGYVWVIDEIDRTYIKVPAVYFEYADGLTLEQHREIRKLQALNSIKDGSHDAMLEGRYKLAEQIRAMTESNNMRRRRQAEILGSRVTKTLENKHAAVSDRSELIQRAGNIKTEDLPIYPTA